MNKKLSESVLNLYKNVTEDKNTTFAKIRKDFVNFKVTEPMIHSSPLLGKVPNREHILEDDLIEEKFGF